MRGKGQGNTRKPQNNRLFLFTEEDEIRMRFAMAGAVAFMQKYGKVPKLDEY